MNKKITFFDDTLLSPEVKLFISFKYCTIEAFEVQWYISEAAWQGKSTELET